MSFVNHLNGFNGSVGSGPSKKVSLDLDLELVRLIEDELEGQKIVEEILQNGTKVVALDCEGDSLGSNPASLIQIAVPVSPPKRTIPGWDPSMAAAAAPHNRSSGHHHHNQNNHKSHSSDGYSHPRNRNQSNQQQQQQSNSANFSQSSLSTTRSSTSSSSSSSTQPNNSNGSAPEPLILKHPKIYLFDVHQNPRLFATLEPLFSRRAIVKVIHDCSQDLKALYQFNRIRVRNVFDTQIAHQVLERQNGRNPIKIGINNLSAKYNGPSVNGAKEQLKLRYRQAARSGVAYWNIRPLTKEHVFHAAHDVFVLVPFVYQTMRDSFEEDYWHLFQQEIGSFINKFAPSKSPYDFMSSSSPSSLASSATSSSSSSFSSIAFNHTQPTKTTNQTANGFENTNGISSSTSSSGSSSYGGY